MTEVLYERADLTAQQLQAEIHAFFAEAGDDPKARQDAMDAGVDLDDLLAAGPDQVDVEPGDAGFTGFEEAVLIMLLTPIVETAWSDVVLPWLRRRRNRPVGEEAKPKE